MKPSLKSIQVLFSALMAMGFTVQADDANLMAEGAKVEELSSGYLFTEGPAVDKDGNVFFTDQPNDRSSLHPSVIPVELINTGPPIIDRTHTN